MVNIVLNYLPGGDVILDYVSPTSSSNITSDAYILPHSTANPYYYGIAAPTVTIAESVLNKELFDVDLKHDCNHILSSGRYTLNSCPRCLGNGYYYDIQFNEVGLVETTSKIKKLQQELEKATLTESNPFHPGYGAALLAQLGKVPVSDLKVIIRNDLIATINFLKEVQAKEAAYVTFSADERILKIERITIDETDVTTLAFFVEILTVSRENISLSGTVVF